MNTAFNRKRWRNTLLAIGGAIMLASCGGGSGGPATQTADNLLTGYFYDSPVQGLEYRYCGVDGFCGSGVTGNNGAFQYRLDDQVDFSLGGLQIGGVRATTESFLVTPYKITETTERAEQIGQLLQSLDADSDPTNGIEIKGETLKAAAVAYPNRVEYNQQGNLQILSNLSPNKTLVPLVQAKEHVQASRKIDQLMQADSDIAKAILGQKLYNPSDSNFNVTRLDASMQARLALQLYYRNLRIFDAGFSQWREKYETIDQSRDAYNAGVEMIKSLADVALLELPDSGKAAQVAAYSAVAMGHVVNHINSVLKVSGATTDLNDAQVDAITLEDSTVDAIKTIANFAYFYADPELGNGVDMLNGMVKLSPEAADWQKKLADAVGAWIKCAVEGRTVSGGAGCLADQTELVSKMVVDAHHASALMSNQEYMNAHMAARDYLTAWYQSGQDTVFMKENLGIPVLLSEAAEHFYKKNEYWAAGLYGLERKGINKPYFIRLVTQFKSDLDKQLYFYNHKLGFGGQVMQLQLQPIDGVVDGYLVGQGVQTKFLAMIGLPAGYTLQSLTWYVAGHESDTASLTATPLQSGASTATVIFTRAGPHKISAYAEALGPNGETSVVANAYTVMVNAIDQKWKGELSFTKDANLFGASFEFSSSLPQGESSTHGIRKLNLNSACQLVAEFDVAIYRSGSAVKLTATQVSNSERCDDSDHWIQTGDKGSVYIYDGTLSANNVVINTASNCDFYDHGTANCYRYSSFTQIN